MKEEATVSLAAADNTDDEVSVDAAAFYFFLIRTGHHFLDKRRRKIRRQKCFQSWPVYQGCWGASRTSFQSFSMCSAPHKAERYTDYLSISLKIPPTICSVLPLKPHSSALARQTAEKHWPGITTQGHSFDRAPQSPTKRVEFLERGWARVEFFRRSRNILNPRERKIPRTLSPWYRALATVATLRKHSSCSSLSSAASTWPSPLASSPLTAATFMSSRSTAKKWKKRSLIGLLTGI